MKRFVYFLLFSSLYIAAASVVLCIQTNIILDIPLNHIGFYVFVFGSTLVQYNLHYLSKPASSTGSIRVVWSGRNRRIHFLMLAIGTGMILYGLFFFHLEQFIVLAVLGAITFLYSFPYLPIGGGKRLKDFGIIKILVLTLVWTIVTVWLPVSSKEYFTLPFWLVFVRRFVFVFVLCLIFDVRDMKWDGAEGIQTIPVLIGKKRTYIFSYLFLAVFFLFIWLDPTWISDRYQMALYLSGLLTLAVIIYSRKHMSDITCLLGIDGMMLAQGVLVWLFSPLV